MHVHTCVHSAFAHFHMVHSAFAHFHMVSSWSLLCTMACHANVHCVSLPPSQSRCTKQGATSLGILPHPTTPSTDACGGSSSRSGTGRGLQGYSSPLLCLRGYIASPQFWRHHPYRLKSSTFLSRVNPKQVMCRYGLQGVCRDSSCDK